MQNPKPIPPGRNRPVDPADREPNPYASRLKKQVTIRLDEGTIAYFKGLADEIGMPYQTLINLYLRDCAAAGWRLEMAWMPRG